jgi:predicted nucleic acid-binding protein
VRVVLDVNVLISARLEPRGPWAALLRAFTEERLELIVSPKLLADPDDDYLVALARAGGADYLVTGDQHLTGLQDPRSPVLTPRELFDRLETHE